ncbi:hypothetical protein AB6A40_000225 [Gnathostoma spinigerum]|uniref:Uncharacterized protein n=1 Tax=Gnathostoma spinigerum TaxID=75299 RepID=A0ABD6E3N4_9BILA
MLSTCSGRMEISFVSKLSDRKPILHYALSTHYQTCWINYHRDFDHDFEDITTKIDGCNHLEEGEKCPYEAFHKMAERYYPGDPEKLCDDVIRPSTPGYTEHSWWENRFSRITEEIHQ